MYLKHFLLLIVASSILSLIWSMINYSHYIHSQLWLPQSNTAFVINNIHVIQPAAVPNSESQLSAMHMNDANYLNALHLNINALRSRLGATPPPATIANNISYQVPRIHITQPSSTYTSLSHYFDKSVVFMGMIANAESHLPHILQQLHQVSCIFQHTLFFFFESNSMDSTSDILDAWSHNHTFTNSAQLNEYCAQIIITDDSLPTRVVYKHILHSDTMVRKELNIEIRKRSNSSYTHKLSRVEKFVPYRNMMLSQLSKLMILNHSHIAFDYLFMIDLDVFEIDFISFLQELMECDTDIMCINGVDQYNDYRDSFATVEMTHNWIHRPFIFNKTDGYYDKARNILRKKMPRKKKRFERVRSCFNGLTAYNLGSFPVPIHATKCRYYLDDDVLLLKRKVKPTPPPSWIADVTKLINWSHLKGAMFDIDTGYESNLCEHIAFHYCLADRYDITLSIAQNTKLYYYPLAPTLSKEDRRAKRRRKRRATRQHQRQGMVQGMVQGWNHWN